MSTETHTEAGGLAEANTCERHAFVWGWPIEGGHGSIGVCALCGAITTGERDERIADDLTARLTDDDVVEAAARAIAAREGSRCFEQELTWSADRRAGFRDGTRAALQAAADVIGGEHRD